MEAFLVQENLDKLLPEIYKQVEEESPKEACGLVVEIENELKYIPLENQSSEKEHFAIDPKQWVRYSIISKIKYVVPTNINFWIRFLCPKVSVKQKPILVVPILGGQAPPECEHWHWLWLVTHF